MKQEGSRVLDFDIFASWCSNVVSVACFSGVRDGGTRRIVPHRAMVLIFHLCCCSWRSAHVHKLHTI